MYVWKVSYILEISHETESVEMETVKNLSNQFSAHTTEPTTINTFAIPNVHEKNVQLHFSIYLTNRNYSLDQLCLF